MKKIFRTTLAASIALTLAACGGSDKKDPVVIDPPPPTTLEITGQAVKGIFAGALVEVFNANDLTTAIGSVAQTDEAGNYTVTITDEAGEPIVGAYVVQVTADEDSTMNCDASVCGDIVRGQAIPAADLVGLTLSSFTYSDGTAGNVEANVNALTTMATDTILAAVAANENINFDELNQAGITSLQMGASQVVGALLGPDLSATNIFNVDIIDATTFTVDTPIDVTTNTLTFINAAFSGLDNDAVTGLANPIFVQKSAGITSQANGVAALGLSDTIASYLSTFKAIVALLVVPDGATNVTADQLALITGTQEQFFNLVADIVVQVGADTGLVLEVEEILTEVTLEEIIAAIGEVEAGSGGTGGTTP